MNQGIIMTLHKQQKILIIEDGETARLLITRLLEQEGYLVKGAADGVTGLLLAEEWNPDLIVLDLGLPDMSGADLAGLLVNHPYIVVTASKASDQFDHMRKKGALAYVVKPVNPDAFIRQVGIAIDRGRDAVTLRRAITETRQVAQALGLLMGRYTIDEREALEKLRSESKKHQRRVTEIAQQMIREFTENTQRRNKAMP